MSARVSAERPVDELRRFQRGGSEASARAPLIVDSGGARSYASRFAASRGPTCLTYRSSRE